MPRVRATQGLRAVGHPRTLSRYCRRRMIMALVALMLVTGLAAPKAAAKTDQILVVPFETPGRDGRTYWLGEAVAVLMADDMNARGLGAIPRQVRERAYEQLH